MQYSLLSSKVALLCISVIRNGIQFTMIFKSPENTRIYFKCSDFRGYSLLFFIWKSNDPTPRREILPNLIIWSFQVVFRAFHCFAASESKIVSHGFAQTSVIQLIKAGLMFSSNLKFIICSVNYIAGWVHHHCESL